MWLNLPGLTALLTVCSLCGMVIYAQYRDCDPLKTKKIEASDQVWVQVLHLHIPSGNEGALDPQNFTLILQHILKSCQSKLRSIIFLPLYYFK